jgi:hypothetical protein
MRITLELQLRTRTGKFRIWLKESKGKEFFRTVRRHRRSGPAGTQEIGPDIGGRGAKLASDLGEKGGPVLFDDEEKLRKAGCDLRFCSASILLAREWAGRPLDSRPDAGATSCCVARRAFETLEETFLKTSDGYVETKYLGRKGMLGSQVFCAPDALPPGGVRHRAIIGLQLEFVQPRSPEFHPKK